MQTFRLKKAKVAQALFYLCEGRDPVVLRVDHVLGPDLRQSHCRALCRGPSRTLALPRGQSTLPCPRSLVAHRLHRCEHVKSS